MDRRGLAPCSQRFILAIALAAGLSGRPATGSDSETAAPVGPNRVVAMNRFGTQAVLEPQPPRTSELIDSETGGGPVGTDSWEAKRRRMVEELATVEGIQNARVLEAMRALPRHEFVSKRWRPWAYAETALPIGHAQTLTPPSLVAYMTEQLDVQPHHRVLEVGTGCGYQAAILGRLAKSVYTVEIVGALGRRARTALRRLNSTNVQVRIGDGFRGWPEAAPFDRILVTCSPEEVPAPLLAQLAEGGCLIAPLGAPYQQTLYRFTKSGASVARQALLPTVFVPMTGEAAAKRTRTADPLHPILSNGSFEQTERETGQLAGWYHQKQLSREHAPDAPGGKAYVTFRNAEPGRAAHAAQAFPVDGHRVRRLKIAGWAKSDNVRPGTQPNQIAALVVAFYDANRALVAEQAIGDWRGTSTWQPFESRVDVPPGAREAVAMIGLHGATGRLSFALLTLEADSPREGAAASRD